VTSQVVLFALLVLVTLGNATMVYSMLPGQSFASWPADTAWYVDTWKGHCVVKPSAASDENIVPYALIHLATGASCPVATRFNDTTGSGASLWRPFPANATSPKVLIFNGTRADKGSCRDNAVAIENRLLLNAMLSQLGAGDTLQVPPGTFCMAAGVRGQRLQHVTIDIQGDLFFSQDHQHWSNASGSSSFANAILFLGITNVTLTSSTRSGLIRARGCTDWYLQREFQGVNGPPPMLEIASDPELTYASSQVVVEYLTLQDGPNWQSYFNKVTDVLIHHVKVDITCSRPGTTVGNLLGALALNTDGIDIWGSNIHVHDVDVNNADDCICVKGDNDGSRLWSENWMVENSTASGEGLSVGTMWSGNFITRNVTFRNILMENTRKGIYVKIDTTGNSAEVLYQNITLSGHTLQFPVMVGPIHQFSHTNCDWDWPFFEAGTCSVQSASRVNITIDGLRILGRPNGLPLLRTADFVVVGNNKSDVTVTLSNVVVEAKDTAHCDDPPLSHTGTCGNACYSANVISDGSYKLDCVPWGSTVPAGTCAPLLGSVGQRCAGRNSTNDHLCYSGQRCT